MFPASADFIKASRNTIAAYFTEDSSRSSFKLLMSTGAQKRSIAACVWPFRRSQERKSSALSSGTPARMPARRARCPACPAARAVCSAETKLRCETVREETRLDEAGTATGLDKGNALVPAHLILDAKAMVEIEQIGAAAKQHVLAVVDHLTRAGTLVGASTAAKVRSGARRA